MMGSYDEQPLPCPPYAPTSVGRISRITQLPTLTNLRTVPNLVSLSDRIFKFNYVSAFFVGVFLECVMYGIFVALFIAACYVQREKLSKGQGVNRVMAFATVFFGFTITTYCVFSLYQVIRAVLYAPPGVTVQQYLNPPYSVGEIVRRGVFQLEIVVADVIMAYRMFHIYDRNPLVCVIPSVTIAALFAVGCGLTNQLRDLATPHGKTALSGWVAACFSLTLFNSLFLTVMISFRLWRVHRETARVNMHTNESIIFRAMKVLIESAALWTSFVAMNFFAYLAKSNLEYTFLEMTNPAVGISFCLIIVRLGRILPETRDETWRMSTRTPSSRTPGSDPFVVPFAQVKVQRDVYVSSSCGSPAETLVSQKRGYVNPSHDLPKIIRASLNLHTSVREGISKTSV